MSEAERMGMTDATKLLDEVQNALYAAGHHDLAAETRALARDLRTERSTRGLTVVFWRVAFAVIMRRHNHWQERALVAERKRDQAARALSNYMDANPVER